MWLSRNQAYAFENYGGTYQLRIESEKDLQALTDLPAPFWMATSAPLSQLACDPVLLSRLDKDDIGRIHSNEMRDAARWLLDMLRDFSGVDARSDTLRLASLNPDSPEAVRLLESARRVLENLGKEQDETLTLADIRNRQAIFRDGARNGDGIIPPGDAADPEVRGLIEDIIATTGCVTDRSGTPGVDRTLLDAFLESARAFVGWHQQRQADAASGPLLPFGSDTPAKYALYHEMLSLVDRYFRLCQVAQMEKAMGASWTPPEAGAHRYAGEEEARDYLASLPLAPPRSSGALPAGEEINPLYRAQFAGFIDEVATPLLGTLPPEGLTEADWTRIQAAFAPYESWLEAKPGGEVEALDLAALQHYLGSGSPEQLRELIEADIEAGKALDALADLEHLALLQSAFVDLCNNFVSFPHLYHPEHRAMFEAGEMVMAGRVFNMNLRIENPAAHSAAATRSGIYLLYSEVTGAGLEQPQYIVTPVTRGPVHDLGMDKRGVLFDAEGQQFDTRVVAVVQNPVSLWEAILAPFKRLAALVSAKAESITSGAEQQLQSQVTQAATSVETGLKEGITAAPTEPGASPGPALRAEDTGTGKFRDLALAGGAIVAGFSALGSSFAFMASTVAESRVQWWHLLAVAVAVLAVVLVPTVIIAWFKLRRQNLSAILEASGWAINAPMRFTRSLRRLIVEKPSHPKSMVHRQRDLVRVFARMVHRRHTSA